MTHQKKIRRSVDAANPQCKVGWFMVFDATFNNITVISWRSVLLVEDTGVPRKNH